MTDLTPITALGGTTPLDQRIGALRIFENTGLALASVAQRRGATRPAPLGLTLPGPGEWAQGADLEALWTAPDQWLIALPDRAADDVTAELAALAPGCAITEQTDGWVAFEIEADSPAQLRAMMAKLVNLDADAFGPGSGTRTLMGHMGVLVIRRAADRLAILGMRSMAGSIWQLLRTTALRQQAAG